MSPAAVGFVGLGAMGAPIAGRSPTRGHELLVHDRDPMRRRAGRGARCRRRAGARAVADAAEIVLVSLPTPAAVREVAVGEDGLVEGRGDPVYVDLSTTGAVVAGEVAATLAGSRHRRARRAGQRRCRGRDGADAGGHGSG